MKNVVIFGASGDTGRYLVPYLLENLDKSQYQLVAAGRRQTDYFAQYGVPYRRVDITRPEDFACLPEQVYGVVDLAGVMPARMSGYEPQDYIDGNITGTLNVLQYCRRAGADRILYAQSFGDIKDHAEKNKLLTVDLPRQFSFTSDHTVYVMSKNFAVDLIEHFHQLYGLKRFIFRLPTIYLYSHVDHYYVDGELRRIGYRLLIDRACQGEPLEVWGDPSREKDMVYVKDFCQMLMRALLVQRDCGYYNVGTGVGTALLDQIRGMAEVFNPEDKKSELIMRPDKPNAPQYVMDITPACEELGYAPQWDYMSWLRDFKSLMLRTGHQANID